MPMMWTAVPVGIVAFYSLLGSYSKFYFALLAEAGLRPLLLPPREFPLGSLVGMYRLLLPLGSYPASAVVLGLV